MKKNNNTKEWVKSPKYEKCETESATHNDASWLEEIISKVDFQC